jgi:hypothetical protein
MAFKKLVDRSLIPGKKLCPLVHLYEMNQRRSPHCRLTSVDTYLIQRIKGHVITSQFKAWNDTTLRISMFSDLLMKPIKDTDGKALLWMDNCGVHSFQLMKQQIEIE